jgi:hypothetical protein
MPNAPIKRANTSEEEQEHLASVNNRRSQLHLALAAVRNNVVREKPERAARAALERQRINKNTTKGGTIEPVRKGQGVGEDAEAFADEEAEIEEKEAEIQAKINALRHGGGRRMRSRRSRRSRRSGRRVRQSRRTQKRRSLKRRSLRRRGRRSRRM